VPAISLDELSTVLIAVIIVFGSQYLGHASEDAWEATKRWYRRKRRPKKK
jgi:hypothetical protein